ncbi:MAG: cupredoxin domain-containing protein [Synechococcales cyanobacterium M58_A2018_015]|nr:cupredoxin domain-containing protein [Synechococcales cyanobacterium M58_A2018_015]
MQARRFIGTLTSIGLLTSIGGTAAEAAISETSMPHNPLATPEFRHIEQPLALRLGVSAVVIALIGLELWWFLGSQPQSQQARSQQGIQELDIIVDGGYEPSRIVVQAGQPVRLYFLRRDPSSCLEQVLIPDFQIAEALPLNQRTAVEFTPKRPGNYPFTCGMNMFRGVIQVVHSQDQAHILPMEKPMENLGITEPPSFPQS